jgi:hypothetical protein
VLSPACASRWMVDCGHERRCADHGVFGAGGEAQVGVDDEASPRPWRRERSGGHCAAAGGEPKQPLICHEDGDTCAW